ncbi:hypothetical protein PUN28_008921 [Cardiocondyla obscurior]|uniref:Uncharacterized protein n=1 Tax=Cardiocondyla obscurior TaxID=286306 RepID=A0AAW2FV30_9HYME
MHLARKRVKNVPINLNTDKNTRAKEAKDYLEHSSNTLPDLNIILIVPFFPFILIENLNPSSSDRFSKILATGVAIQHKRLINAYDIKRLAVARAARGSKYSARSRSVTRCDSAFKRSD